MENVINSGGTSKLYFVEIKLGIYLWVKLGGFDCDIDTILQERERESGCYAITPYALCRCPYAPAST